MAAAASTQTAARGTMQGSCRPRISAVRASPVTKLTVCCGLAMEGVGLKAARKRSGIPLEMPPWIPPAALRLVRIFPPSLTKGSLLSLPRMRAAENPAPNSTPFTAGMAKRR